MIVYLLNQTSTVHPDLGRVDTNINHGVYTSKWLAEFDMKDLLKTKNGSIYDFEILEREIIG